MLLHANNNKPAKAKPVLVIPDSFEDIAVTKRCIKELSEAGIVTPAEVGAADDETLIACYGINKDNLEAFKAKCKGVK